MPFDRPLRDVELVALDLETTGLAPGFDRITEIGAVRFRVGRDGVVTPGPVFETLVDPGRPIPVPVVRLTGIDDAMVAGAPSLAEAWPRLEAFLGEARAASDGAVALMAHSAEFDLSFLVAAAHRLGRSWDGPPVLCTVRIARASLPNAPRYRLATLVEWLGCARPDGVHHRALADALDARNVFAHCVRARRPTRLGELRGASPLVPPDAAELALDVPERLVALERCIDAQARVGLVYRGGTKGRVRRPVTPLAFYKRGGVLYLRAWCHLDDVAKSFRCDRIVSVDASAT